MTKFIYYYYYIFENILLFKYGMEKTIDPAHEIGENVTITDRSQLLSITPEQAKKIKSLRIENQVIDGYFLIFFRGVSF